MFDINKILEQCPFVLAPMVDGSELPFRRLCREYGATLCFSPMIHAGLYSANEKCLRETFSSDDSDRPLVIQFCANDSKCFLISALRLQKHCDAVDLNLGCPQGIARRGHYGAFLQDEWDLICEILSTAVSQLSVSVSAKIRLHGDFERTIAYAKRLEATGISWLTVHGRTREQKGALAGKADLDAIKAVKQALKIPVIANGNVASYSDAVHVLTYTGCDGVMIAEAALHNPTIFNPKHEITPVDSCDVALRYLDLCRRDPVVLSIMRAHIFKLLYYPCVVLPRFRELLGSAATVDEISEVVKQFSVEINRERMSNAQVTTVNGSRQPYWACQARLRDMSGSGVGPTEKDAGNETEDAIPTTRMQLPDDVLDADGNAVSKNRLKKLMRRNVVKQALKNGATSTADHKLMLTKESVESMVKPVMKRQADEKMRQMEASAAKKAKRCVAEECLNVHSTKCDNLMCKKCCIAYCIVNKVADTDSWKCSQHFQKRNKDYDLSEPCA